MIASEEEARSFVAARCDPVAFRKIENLVADLKSETMRQNLVSASSLQALWTRHIADSAQLLDHAPTQCDLWLDLGTGAGLPGLVIALMRPEWTVRLIECRKLRVAWLESQVAKAELRNTAVLGQRLQYLAAVPASVISARAFAPLPELISLAMRFSTSDTTWLLPKGRSAAQEVGRLPPNLRRMFHVEQSATDGDSAILIGRIAGDGK